ncbi:MAG: GNAT family N-acetyltransferase [Oscillospiraceae bacterium]|nr:GNAT family N-acetyltransferase [Oscillospiraceae bacterium]
MTTVYLIRHAEAEGNLYRRSQGHYNATITDRGYAQIAALSRRFADVPIDAAYSSDLARTQTTALAVTLSHGLPLHTTEQLREVCMGEWEDRTWADLSYHDKEMLIRFNNDAGNWHVPGAQDVYSVRDRMRRAIEEIIAAHPNQTVAVFSHGMALRLLIGTLQGLSIAEIDKTSHGENTAVTKLEADERGIRVIYRDDASHLSEELTTLHRQLWTKNKGGLEPGIYFRPSGRDGHFDVLSEETVVGAVSVGRCADGVAQIEEYWLEEAEQRKNYGIQLLGQAISYARAQGCDRVRAVIPRSDALGLHCAERWGMYAVRANAELVVMEKYFGYDPDYRIMKLKEALGEK